MLLNWCVLGQIQPNLLLKIFTAEFHVRILWVYRMLEIWTLGNNTHSLVSMTVDVYVVIIAPFEFLVDPVQSLQVLSAHHSALFATLVAHRVGLAQ